MALDMTRRGFGVLVLATSALPSVAFANPEDYAFPELLENADRLLPLAEIGPDQRPLFEDAGMVLIDVRTRDTFDAGHIPGAQHLDPNAVVAATAPISGALKPESEIAALLGGLGVSPSRRIVLYDDRDGLHAARMFWLLEYLGHQDVALLNGGFAAWQSAGGPMETESLAPSPSTFTPSAMPRRRATADYILERREDPETVIIDVRPRGPYEEGHIPWAVNIPWSNNLREDGLFLPARELRAHFEAHGVTGDRNVVIHCQIGLASSHSYLALRLLGYPRIRVYHRSWAEWGSDPSLPAATGA